MSESDTFEMACEFLRESDAAVLILDHANGEDLWIPLSQINEMHRNPDHTGKIVMTRWIARKKGLC